MMKVIIKICLIWLLFITPVYGLFDPMPDPEPIKNCKDYSHIKDFGFYHVWTSDKRDNYINEVVDFSTFAHVYAERRKVKAAINNGLRAVVDIHKVMHSKKWKRKFKDTVEPLIREFKHDILGLYVYDEPYWNGVSYSKFNTQTKWIKSRWPKIKLWTTICFNQINDNLKIPRFLNRISITPNYNNCSASQMKGWLKILKSKMRKHQKIVLTIDGFQWHSLLTTEEMERTKKRTINDYWKIAKCDKRIKAIWVFMWPSYSDGTGTRDMPIVKKKLKRIGRKIY